MRRGQLLLEMLLMAGLGGCWRYRAVHDTCPSEAPPSTAFEATVIRTSGNEVRGRVVGADSSTPIANASVGFPTAADAQVVTTANGEFTLRVDTLGVYTLRARHIGYQQALGRLRVRADSGGPLLVAMHQTVVMLDGCGYAQIREPRPWWQWWFPPNDR